LADSVKKRAAALPFDQTTLQLEHPRLKQAVHRFHNHTSKTNKLRGSTIESA
jgi:hypothetical protein